MKYFLDTEFIEGKQSETFLGFKYGKTKPTIDLISIGIVSEDCCDFKEKGAGHINEELGNYCCDKHKLPFQKEYYAISKDFNLKEAWNRYNIKQEWYSLDDSNQSTRDIKVYWLRDNVLKPIYDELFHKWCTDTNSLTGDEFVYFNYSNLKKLITKYGKTNKQIAEEIKEFTGTEDVIEFYGYYSAYDWVAFCWLFNKMIELPKGYNWVCKDLKQMLDDKLKVTNIESKLWDLLDNIDSASDMFKPNNEDKYVQYIYSKLKHHELLKCDGYNIISKYKTVKEIQALPNYPKQTNEHNALADAKWNKKLYEFLTNI